jgi:GT2 family glycosyltransferase
MLSVIIPTRHRNDLLAKCLEKLHPDIQQISGDDYEVIITDDSENNPAQALINDQFPWARWIEGPRKGPAANRNNGAKHAKGAWLVFIDDDCLPESSLLRAYRNEINKNEFKALEGSIEKEHDQTRYDEVAPINTTGGNFWSCNIALEKEVFISVNGFNEGFPYPTMEDTDLYNTLRQKTAIKFLPEAKVIHPWRIMAPFRNYKIRLISNKYYLRKNNIPTNLDFRIQRIKIFIGFSYGDFTKLRKYSYKGYQLYLERVWFHFLMIFI